MVRAEQGEGPRRLGLRAVSDAREVKRSLSIAGHRTSVSLEAPFWDELKAIAKLEGKSIAALIGEIDVARPASAGGLSSAIRVFILTRLKARVGEAQPR